MLVALGPIGFCLALMAFMPSLWTMALLVFAFFFAYYVYEPPYRGLYPDLLPERIYGRAQGAQHLMRGLALGIALIGGGVLFHVWEPSRSCVAAFVVVAACAAPIVFVREDGGHGRVFEGVRAYSSTAGRLPPRSRRAALPDREHGVGGDVRRRAHLRRPLHHGRARPAARDDDGRARRGRGRLHRRGRRLGRRSATGFGLARVIVVRSFVYGLGLLARRLRATSGSGWYLPAHLRRRDRRRAGDDARVGPALQADAAGRPRRDLGARDDDEGRSACSSGRSLAGAAIDLSRRYLEDTHGYQALWPILARPGAARDPARLAAVSGRARRWGGTARKPRADHLGRRTR